jgi:tetratricopeptide (TPR) repeat protein
MSETQHLKSRSLILSTLLLVLIGNFQSTRGQVPEGTVSTRPSSPRVNTTGRNSDSRNQNGSLSPAAKKRREIEEAISAGNKAREAGDYQNAFAGYRRVADGLNPKDPRAVYGMGAVYSDLTCNDKAIQSFIEALRIDNDFHDALIALGYLYATKQRYEEADAQFRAVFRKKPNDAPAMIGLAYVTAKKKQYDNAINQFKLIIDTPAISKKERAAAYLHLGNTYFDQKKWDEAAAAYKKAIENDPDLSAAYLKLGQVELFPQSRTFSYLAVQEMTIADRDRLIKAAKRAADYIVRAINEHNFKHPVGNLFLAHALLNQFNYHEAIVQVDEYFGKLNELKAQSSALAANCDAGFKELSVAGYFYLAFIYNQQALFETKGAQKDVYFAQVVENANKVIEVRENDPMAHSLLGEVYFQQGKWSEAIRHFEKAVSHETNEEAQASSFDFIGMSYEQLGNDIEAIRAYNNALTLSPDSTSARFGLSHIHEKKGDFDKAISLKEEAIDLTPEPSASLLWQLAGTYFSRARATNRDEDYEKAIALLKKALEKNQSFWGAYFTLGNVYKFYKNGSYADQSLANYQQAEKYVPENPAVKFMIADLFYSVKNNYEAAINYLEQAIKLKPDYIDAHFLLGIVHRDKEDYVEAIKELSTTLDLNDKYLLAYTELAELYDRQKRSDEAITILLKAASKLPTEYMPQKELARIYSHQGKNKQAIERYETAISLMTAEPEWRRELFRCRILRLQTLYADSITCVQSIKLPNPVDMDQIYYEIGLINVATKNRTAALAKYEQLKQMKSSLAQDLLRQINELK